MSKRSTDQNGRFRQPERTRSRHVTRIERAPKRERLSLRRLRSIWRDRGRPVWRELRPLVVVVLAAAVLVLGTIGFQNYQEIHNDTSYGLLDALYRAVQLFGLGGTLEPPIPTTLQIARILGPMVAGYAVIRGLLALSREQVQLLWFRLFLRNHVVVAGLGTAGFRMATKLYAEGYRVVAIERRADNSAIQGCRERGIGVLRGDSTDPSILRNARIDRADRLVVTCGSDGTNVDVATAASNVISNRESGVLTALVHLDDFGLLGMMKAQSLTSQSTSAFRLALFNVFATGAAILLEEHPPFLEVPEGPGPHILLVGFDGVAASLVLDILRLWQFAEKSPEATLLLTIAGPRASLHRKELLSRHPDINELTTCRLEAWDVALDSAEFPRAEIRGRPSAVYVSLETETQAMTVALKLSGRSDLGDTPVVVVVPDESTGVATALRSGGPLLKNVVPFGLFTQAFASAAFLHTTNEALARASHDTHVRSVVEAVLTEEDDPSLVPWERLPERLRESNRLFADSIPAKLAEIGCVVELAPLADPRHPSVTLVDEEIERLAPMEHDRWSSDMQRHFGYQRTVGEKETSRGLHPLVGVPFSELPKENQDKDRGKVRSIPEILAGAGFKIVRDAGRETAGRDGLEVPAASADVALDRARNKMSAGDFSRG